MPSSSIPSFQFLHLLSVSLERFFLIKKARLLLSHQTGQFQPLSLWIKSFDIQLGKGYWVTEVYTWVSFSRLSDWLENSSLDRPIHMHKSLQIGLCTHIPINHFLPWAPCGARLAPSCLSGPPWPLHCNSKSLVEKHKEAGVFAQDCWAKGLYSSPSPFLQGISSGENTFSMKHYKLLIIYVYLLF